VACAELAATRRIPEYVIETTRDWVNGEVAASGRSRGSLLGVMDCLHRFGGTPVGQAGLAREAGLANNTVAAGYVEQLMDLLCIAEAFAWDASRRRASRRRPRKYHFTNLLAAVAWHPARIRSVSEYDALSPEEQGRLTEWLVAQELWRRAAIRGDEIPESMHFWQGKTHEVHFVVDAEYHVEVKRGQANPLDFSWWPQTFPRGQLTVINRERFETERFRGVTLEDFLLEDE
jgi:predicted AAA+ superfamily ATPase